VIEDHQIRVVRCCDSGDFFNFAGADQRRRIGTAAALENLRDHRRASAFHEFTKLHKRSINAEFR
jgi:hypothetical protein